LVTVTNPKPLDPLFTATQTVNVATVTVSPRKPVAVKQQLAGPTWVDAGGCCGSSVLRAALNPICGQRWAAQRFAIDYLQLDADRRLTNGPADRLDSYAYFGADIHAVGDGTVVGVVDGLPEQVPTKPPSGLPLDQFPGNHVVQDLGGGNYALYAHMKTGTVKVKPGDRLTPGQVIGSVGNTGNSTAPHLHFHVMNTPDPLRSDGLPFVFDDFRLTDRIVNPDDVEAVIAGSPAAMQPSLPARDETGVMPLELDVMTYANRWLATHSPCGCVRGRLGLRHRVLHDRATQSRRGSHGGRYRRDGVAVSVRRGGGLVVVPRLAPPDDTGPHRRDGVGVHRRRGNVDTCVDLCRYSDELHCGGVTFDCRAATRLASRRPDHEPQLTPSR
jgi:hypothetical protein